MSRVHNSLHDWTHLAYKVAVDSSDVLNKASCQRCQKRRDMNPILGLPG
jgi:hypothetical protein